MLYIVHPDLEASIDTITDRVRKIIEDRGGKITYEENWGKRKFAYEIQKTEVGIYFLWYFEVESKNLDKIERDLRFIEEIMRFMVLKVAEKIKAKTTPSKEVPAKITKPIPKTQAAKEKITPKAKNDKIEKVSVENEKKRMKELDKKLDAILGKKNDNKSTAQKAKERK